MNLNTSQVFETKDSEILYARVEDAQNQLSELAKAATEDKRILLTQGGKEVAAVISIEAFRFLERVVEKLEDEMDLEALQAARRSKNEPNIKLEELKQELGF